MSQVLGWMSPHPQFHKDRRGVDCAMTVLHVSSDSMSSVVPYINIPLFHPRLTHLGKNTVPTPIPELFSKLQLTEQQAAAPFNSTAMAGPVRQAGVYRIIKRRSRSWAGKTAATASSNIRLSDVHPDNYLGRGRVVATKALGRKPFPETSSQSDVICCMMTWSLRWSKIMNASADTELCTYTHYSPLFLPPICSGSHPYWITWPFCKAKLAS